MRNRRGYALGLLMIIYTPSMVDRQVLSIVFPLVKSDLSLSDTQLGLLSGIVFTLFYATLGVPVAAWAVREGLSLKLLPAWISRVGEPRWPEPEEPQSQANRVLLNNPSRTRVGTSHHWRIGVL